MRNIRIRGAAMGVVGLLAFSATGAAAQDGAIISVAQDGSGDYDTIAAAIAAATDGDTVLLAPGTYAEGLYIDKDITLAGDGTRDDVVIATDPENLVTAEGPEDDVPAAVHLLESEARLERLSIQLGPDQGVVAWIDGGAVSFDDVAFTGDAIALVGGEPRFNDVVIDAYFAVRDGASPTVENSEIIGHASVDGPGRTVIRDSILRGGTSASADATGAYEDNHFIGAQLAVDTGSDMLVKGNLVEGVESEAAIIVVHPGSTAEIVDNTVRDSYIGIAIDTDEPGSSVEGNVISDVRVGIHVDSDGEVPVTDNTIESARTIGIVLEGDGAQVVDNTICGSGRAFDIRRGSPGIFTNEICAALEP